VGGTNEIANLLEEYFRMERLRQQFEAEAALVRAGDRTGLR
jgi:hypothetical protein